MTKLEQVTRERDLLLELLRGDVTHKRVLGKRSRMGLSSESLILSTLAGDPIHYWPWDAGDAEGLTETFECLPEWLRERAKSVYHEQMAQYRAAS